MRLAQERNKFEREPIRGSGGQCRHRISAYSQGIAHGVEGTKMRGENNHALMARHRFVENIPTAIRENQMP